MLTATVAPVSHVTAASTMSAKGATTSAVAHIETHAADGSPSGAGTGVLTTLHHGILTNAHVIEGASAIFVTPEAKAKRIPVRVAAVWLGIDLAVVVPIDASITFEGHGMKPATVALADPAAGETVLSFGYPLGLGFTVTRGVASGIRVFGNLPADYQVYNYNPQSVWIQTDCAINPGSSGGPLFNSNDELIGLNTWVSSADNDVYFAIAISSIRKGLQDSPSGTANPNDIPPQSPRRSPSISPNRTAAAFPCNKRDCIDKARAAIKPGRFVLGGEILAIAELHRDRNVAAQDVRALHFEHPRRVYADSRVMRLARLPQVGLVTDTLDGLPLSAAGIQRNHLIYSIDGQKADSLKAIEQALTDAEQASKDEIAVVYLQTKKVTQNRRNRQVEILMPDNRSRKTVTIARLNDKACQQMLQALAESEQALQDAGPLTATGTGLRENSIGTPRFSLRVENDASAPVVEFTIDLNCFNRLGQPVGFLGDNQFNGIVQSRLNPGDSDVYTWTLNLHDTAKTFQYRFTAVKFSDGTSWFATPQTPWKTAKH